MSQYQKGKTNLDFTEARDSQWQWHQLGHMQVCTSLQTDNHASIQPLSFYRPDALPAANQRQSTEGKTHNHWFHPKCEISNSFHQNFPLDISVTFSHCQSTKAKVTVWSVDLIEGLNCWNML